MAAQFQIVSLVSFFLAGFSAGLSVRLSNWHSAMWHDQSSSVSVSDSDSGSVVFAVSLDLQLVYCSLGLLPHVKQATFAASFYYKLPERQRSVCSCCFPVVVVVRRRCNPPGYLATFQVVCSVCVEKDSQVGNAAQGQQSNSMLKVCVRNLQDGADSTSKGLFAPEMHLLTFFPT